MIGIRITLALPLLAIICFASSGSGPLRAESQSEHATSVETADPAQPQVETREYIAQNGRRIKVTAMGNLVGFESPAGFEHIAAELPEGERPSLQGNKAVRQGYVLSYRDPRTHRLRVLHDVFESRSSTIRKGFPDFVPISFQGPKSKTIFRRGQLVSATALVGTRDGLFLMARNFSWIAGTGSVKIITTLAVTNVVKDAILAISYKGQGDVNVDSGGAYGIRESLGDVLRIGGGPGILFGDCCTIFCECPPDLSQLNQLAVNTHAFLVNGGPDFLNSLTQEPDSVDLITPRPSYINVAPAGDLSELKSPGPGRALKLPRGNEDDQVTIGFIVNRSLKRNQRLRFVEQLDVS